MPRPTSNPLQASVRSKTSMTPIRATNKMEGQTTNTISSPMVKTSIVQWRYCKRTRCTSTLLPKTRRRWSTTRGLPVLPCLPEVLCANKAMEVRTSGVRMPSSLLILLTSLFTEPRLFLQSLLWLTTLLDQDRSLCRIFAKPA